MTEEIKSWKEEREQQRKVDMEEIIRQQQQEHNKDMENKGIKIIKEKSNLVRDMEERYVWWYLESKRRTYP